jgi:hypothetical protein
MKQNFNRRRFIQTATTAGIGFGLMGSLPKLYAQNKTDSQGRVGIIGLDTSHSVAFTKALNATDPAPELKGYKVVAAYPKGSNDIESSTKRIPGYTEEVKKLGVEIVDSIEKLLKKVDVILLETNDGRPHLEQALMVLKSGKPMFIDKPVAGSLKDAIAIYAAAKKYNVPVFSSSSLRYMESVQDVVKGKAGAVSGAVTINTSKFLSSSAFLKSGDTRGRLFCIFSIAFIHLSAALLSTSLTYNTSQFFCAAKLVPTASPRLFTPIQATRIFSLAPKMLL